MADRGKPSLDLAEGRPHPTLARAALASPSEGEPRPTSARAALTGCRLPSASFAMASGGKRGEEEKKRKRKNRKK